MDTFPKSSGSTHQSVGSSACIGLTPNIIPEVSSSVEDSIRRQGCPQSMTEPKIPNRMGNSQQMGWYVLRAAYGSERQTYHYIIQHSSCIDVFWPTHFVTRVKHGRVVHDQGSLIPNILFAHACKEELEAFVYDNYHLPYLRFYYHKYHKNGILMREPLVVPDRQMASFRKIYCSAENDIYIAGDVIQKFTKGQKVCVIGGPFKGVTGRVARFKGQQRVGVVVAGLCTAVTTYIKKKYLKIVNEGE